jgi:2',3'-cyclic-nucleotide 2'-phosphodiesterase (5'-nucleotidase family)
MLFVLYTYPRDHDSGTTRERGRPLLPLGLPRRQNAQQAKAVVGMWRQQPPQQLPWGDVNVVVTTDVHSWVAGHGRHEPALDADYGDVLSFYQHLQAEATAAGTDVFWVMNGDFVDGTGLSTVPPTHLLPLLTRLPFSAINLGNHELYHNETVDYLQQSGFLQHWQGNFLTSNTDWAHDSSPLGHRYTYLYGPNRGTKILTFGFLYNFENACGRTRVRTVQATLQAAWFQAVLRRGDYDAILVLAHMDYLDPLVPLMQQAIRAALPHNESSGMPIQFINGHSHRRGFHAYDDTCTAFEAGRFLDTVGFVSFPTWASVQQRAAAGATTSRRGGGERDGSSSSSLFRHVFLDANQATLTAAIGSNTSPQQRRQDSKNTTHKTPDGQTLTDLIHQTQQDLGLEVVLGCATQSYNVDQVLNASDALWNLYMRQVWPFIFGHNRSQVFVQTTGALRYSLLEGAVNVDDLIAVSPFDDPIFLVAERVSGTDVVAALGDAMETATDPNSWPPPYATSGPVHTAAAAQEDRYYDLYAANWDVTAVRAAVVNVTGQTLCPVRPLVHDDGGAPVTTTGVWKRFVASQWPCADTLVTTPLRRLVDPVPPANLAVALLAVLTLLLSGVLLPRRTPRRLPPPPRATARGLKLAGDPLHNYGSLHISA